MTILTLQDIYNYCGTLNIFRSELSEFIIPDGVTKIDFEAFKECTAFILSPFLKLSLKSV